MELFEKNLARVEQHNPLLAFQLRLEGRKPSLTFEKSIIVDLSTLNDIEVIYIYGLGGYRQLKNWLRKKPTRRLILLEDELSAFSSFLEQVETEAVLVDPQVKILSLTDPLEENLKKVIWPYLFRPYKFYILPASDEQREAKANAFSALFSELHMGTEMTMCLYRDYGVTQLSNVIKNLANQQSVLDGEALKGQFKNIPAIICGAGPSLEKNIDELQALSDKALIFAGGSSLGPLSKKSIPIHFGGSIDPNPPEERFLRQNYFELPFFYQNQLSSTLYSKLQAERICFGDSGVFPLEKWLLEQLNLPLQSFDAGYTATTFLTCIAEKLGCSPIIFVGMDGCQEKDKTYSQGVEEPEETSQRNDPLRAEDQFGDEKMTRADFLLARSWIEAFAAEHPETEFLNATEGGLSYQGINNVPLRDVTLGMPFDGKAKVHSVLTAAKKVTLDVDQVSKFTDRIQKSCASCLTFTEKILESQAHYSIEDVELEEELFYQMVLLPLWEVWRHFLQTEEIVAQMESPEFEKKIQRTLFFIEVCKNYQKEVF